MGANISDLAFVDRKPDFYKIEISAELNGIEHLHSLLTRLEAEGEVASIKRRRGYS
jgi:guanosine-3',5'-bis(diphosphate) 3'-pyrophosphohydrolase